MAFLAGLQPDAVILVVNQYDEFEYINRIISFIRSYSEADVIGIVIYPMSYKNMISGIYGGKKLSKAEVDILCIKIHNTFNIPTYSLDYINGLVDDIIDYFS